MHRKAQKMIYLILVQVVRLLRVLVGPFRFYCTEFGWVLECPIGARKRYNCYNQFSWTMTNWATCSADERLLIAITTAIARHIWLITDTERERKQTAKAENVRNLWRKITKWMGKAISNGAKVMLISWCGDATLWCMIMRWLNSF